MKNEDPHNVRARSRKDFLEKENTGKVRDHVPDSKLRPNELDSNLSLNKMRVRTFKHKQEHTYQNMFVYLSHFRL